MPKLFFCISWKEWKNQTLSLPPKHDNTFRFYFLRVIDGNNTILSEGNHHMWCYLYKRSIKLWSEEHQIIRHSIWQSSEVFFPRRCCHCYLPSTTWLASTKLESKNLVWQCFIKVKGYQYYATRLPAGTHSSRGVIKKIGRASCRERV